MEKLPHLKERETAIERPRGRKNEDRAAEVLSEERGMECICGKACLGF